MISWKKTKEGGQLPPKKTFAEVVTKDQAKKTFASLFQDNRNPTKGMPLARVEGLKGEVDVAYDEVDNMEDALGFALLGYVAGGFPGVEAIKKLASTWHVPHKFHVHKSGWLIFRFDDFALKEKVLQGGPYLIFGRPIILKDMPPLFEFGACTHSIVPAWVTLPGLPIDLWNAKVLGKICSIIGEPICTDEMTNKKERLSYARVLVNVDLDKELVTEVKINLPNGKTREQYVAYESLPKYCSICKMMGHAKELCRRNVDFKEQPKNRDGQDNDPLIGKGEKQRQGPQGGSGKESTARDARGREAQARDATTQGARQEGSQSYNSRGTAGILVTEDKGEGTAKGVAHATGPQLPKEVNGVGTGNGLQPIQLTCQKKGDLGVGENSGEAATKTDGGERVGESPAAVHEQGDLTKGSNALEASSSARQRDVEIGTVQNFQQHRRAKSLGEFQGALQARTEKSTLQALEVDEPAKAIQPGKTELKRITPIPIEKDGKKPGGKDKGKQGQVMERKRRGGSNRH